MLILSILSFFWPRSKWTVYARFTRTFDRMFRINKIDEMLPGVGSLRLRIGRMTQFSRSEADVLLKRAGGRHSPLGPWPSRPVRAGEGFRKPSPRFGSTLPRAGGCRRKTFAERLTFFVVAKRSLGHWPESAGVSLNAEFFLRSRPNRPCYKTFAERKTTLPHGRRNRLATKIRRVRKPRLAAPMDCFAAE